MNLSKIIIEQALKSDENLQVAFETGKVFTDGSMQPAESVELAAKFLRAHVDLFQTLEEEIRQAENIPTHNEDLVMVAAQKEEEPQKGNHDILIKDLEFSVRSRNCLKKAGIQTLGELVDKKVSELLVIKNFGKKSLKEVREKLSQFNLSLPDYDEDELGDIEE